MDRKNNKAIEHKPELLKTTAYTIREVGFGPLWKDDFKEAIEWKFEGHRILIPTGYD